MPGGGDVGGGASCMLKFKVWSTNPTKPECIWNYCDEHAKTDLVIHFKFPDGTTKDVPLVPGGKKIRMTWE